MAPEVLCSEDYAEPADVFSFGIILEVCAESTAPPTSFQCSGSGNLFDAVTVPTPTSPTASSFVAPPTSTPQPTPAFVGGNNDYFYNDIITIMIMSHQQLS